jgi:hypothetical protein
MKTASVEIRPPIARPTLGLDNRCRAVSTRNGATRHCKSHRRSFRFAVLRSQFKAADKHVVLHCERSTSNCKRSRSRRQLHNIPALSPAIKSRSVSRRSIICRERQSVTHPLQRGLSSSSPSPQNRYARDDCCDAQCQERQTPQQHRSRVRQQHGAVWFAAYTLRTEGTFRADPIDQTKAPCLKGDGEVSANHDREDADGFSNHALRCWITDDPFGN